MNNQNKNILTYRSHVAGQGWQDYVNEGQISGTIGQSRQLEAFELQIENADGIGVHAFAKPFGMNWSNGNIQGEIVGTTGLGIALESIKMELFGENKDKYDIWYSVHVSNIGFMGWVRNGEVAGTQGSSGANRIEAIQIIIAEKGKTWLGSNTLEGFKDVTPPPPPVVVSDVRSFGANEFKCACGCGGDVRHELKVKIQKLRDLLSQRAGHDRPIVITSGFRCPAQNRRDGGVSDSLHMEGIACDLYTPGMSRAMVDEIAYCAHQVGLGTIRYYNQLFVHVQLEWRDTIGG